MTSIKDYINRKGYQFKQRGNELLMNCPFCPGGDKERKFSMNAITGAWNCLHLNSCGAKGSFREFQTRHDDEPESIYGAVFYQEKKKSYKIPKVTITKPTNAVYEYLALRGMSGATIQRFGIGSKNENVVMIPYYKDKTLVNVKYRDITDKSQMWTEKEAEPVLFGRDLIEDDTALIICEGEYDAMALWEYQIEAVSVPMGAGNHEWLSNEWDFIDTFKTIYLMFDKDTVGISASKDLATKIGIWKCRLVELPHKDANECLKKGIKREIICECLENAIELQPAHLVSAEEFRKPVHDLFRQGSILKGIPTAWEGLDDILKGWRGGELTVWSGRNSSGKSTILNQHFLHTLGQDVNCCIASLELPPPRYLRWAIIQKTENSNPSVFAIDNCFDWFAGRLLIIDRYDRVESKYIMECFEYAARRYNCKHFILDSLMKVRLSGDNAYKSQEDFVNELSDFAKKYKVHIHLVVHPRKGEKDSDIPGKVDIKGSSHITDIADNVLQLYRLNDDERQKAVKRGKPTDMTLFINKNREFGTEGSMRMLFDETTKRFRDG
jgi:twinkle protein